MNSDSDAPARWRTAGRLAVMTTSTMFGLCLAGIVGAPLANAIPDPDDPPYGGDPGWEALAQDCYEGSMRACDNLANATKDARAPVYFDYGFSCGGRVLYSANDTSGYVSCQDQYANSP